MWTSVVYNTYNVFLKPIILCLFYLSHWWGGVGGGCHKIMVQSKADTGYKAYSLQLK